MAVNTSTQSRHSKAKVLLLKQLGLNVAPDSVTLLNIPLAWTHEEREFLLDVSSALSTGSKREESWLTLAIELHRHFVEKAAG